MRAIILLCAATLAVNCGVYAMEAISVTRDRCEMKTKTIDGDGYIYVTNKIDKAGSVTGKIGSHYVRSVTGKYGGRHLSMFAEGAVKTAEQNLKEPIVVCYILMSSKKNGRKFVKRASSTASKDWDEKTFPLNFKEESKKKGEVPASLWRTYKCSTSSDVMWINVDNEDEIHCYRMELWQDGKLLDVKDTSKLSTLRKLGLDSEWYVDGKNKGKLYVWWESR